MTPEIPEILRQDYGEASEHEFRITLKRQNDLRLDERDMFGECISNMCTRLES